MITASVLLVLVAVCLLGVGVTRGSDVFYYSSIVASAVSALALIVGLRQNPAGRMPDHDFDVGRGEGVRLDQGGRLPQGGRVDQGVRLGEGVRVADGRNRSDVDSAESKPPRPVGRAGVPRQNQIPTSVPRDEPPVQALTNTAAARVARLRAEVAVIDGRPRYHLVECLHLLGREVEWLPVMEAVELGFSPCGQCEPATVLLAGVPRS